MAKILHQPYQLYHYKLYWNYPHVFCFLPRRDSRNYVKIAWGVKTRKENGYQHLIGNLWMRVLLWRESNINFSGMISYLNTFSNFKCIRDNTKPDLQKKKSYPTDNPCFRTKWPQQPGQCKNWIWPSWLSKKPVPWIFYIYLLWNEISTAT